MAEMDRVRFVAGDESEDIPVKVWQGYDAASNTMAGQIVFITAETARQMAEYEWDQMKDDEWNRQHNAPEGFWDLLAYGSKGARLAPDGVTPLYPLDWWTTIIVQRFNPNAGQTYDIVRGGVKIGVGHFGVWENVHPVYGIPEPVGFVVNPQDWAEGRGDTPPFQREDDEEEDEPEKVYVERVKVEFSNGADFEVTQSPLRDDNGTSFSGDQPQGSSDLESTITDALLALNLYPEAADET